MGLGIEKFGRSGWAISWRSHHRMVQLPPFAANVSVDLTFEKMVLI